MQFQCGGGVHPVSSPRLAPHRSRYYQSTKGKLKHEKLEAYPPVMTRAERSANEFCGVRVSVWGVVYDTIAAAPNGAASPGTRRTSAPPYGGVLSCLGVRAGQYQVGVEKTPLSMFCNVGREALLAPPMGHPAVRPPLRAALARSPGSCQL